MSVDSLVLSRQGLVSNILVLYEEVLDGLVLYGEASLDVIH